MKSIQMNQQYNTCMSRYNLSLIKNNLDAIDEEVSMSKATWDENEFSIKKEKYNQETTRYVKSIDN